MLGIVHGGDLRFVCGCSAMETHFMKLLKNSSDVASRGSLNSVVGVATEDRQNFYALQHLAVVL
jgi:hypothetical protein